VLGTARGILETLKEKKRIFQKKIDILRKKN